MNLRDEKKRIGAEALLEAEGGVVAHMNADHRDAMALYARFYGGAEEGEWLCAGVDPRGGFGS